MEVPFNPKDPSSDEETANCIAAIAKKYAGKMLVGSGTVLTVKQVELTAQAGGSYTIAPNTNADVIRRTVELGMVAMPGAMTPTEIEYAHECGAEYVKLFPAGALGVEYFKAIKAPLRHIPVAAVGGVTPENLLLFKKAGACAYGISTGIFNAAAIKSEDYERVGLLAREYVRLAAQQD